MTRTRLDVNSKEVLLDNGQDTTLTLDTQSADRVLFTVDDGASGNEGGTYNLIVSVDQDTGYGFQQVEELSVLDTKALSHTNPAFGRYMEFRIINRSGGTANFRIVAESMRLRF